MSKKAGIFCVIMGVVLMLSALLFMFYNKYEERRAGWEAQLLLADIQYAIEQKTEQYELTTEENIEGMKDTAPIEAEPAELQVTTINEEEYIGYLSIPDLSLMLPVMSEWDYNRLKSAPCRQFGSSATDDLVIAAHNYKTHFGELSKLEAGAEISFTDMNGNQNFYTLSKLETIAPEAVDVIQNGEYDLVLYTCTQNGAARVAAFFRRRLE